MQTTMESRLIYIANEKMKTKVTWSKSGDTDLEYYVYESN